MEKNDLIEMIEIDKSLLIDRLRNNIESLYDNVFYSDDEDFNLSDFQEMVEDLYISSKKYSYKFFIYTDDKIFTQLDIHLSSSINTQVEDAISQFKKLCEAPVKMPCKKYVLKAACYVYGERIFNDDKIIATYTVKTDKLTIKCKKLQIEC